MPLTVAELEGTVRELRLERLAHWAGVHRLVVAQHNDIEDDFRDLARQMAKRIESEDAHADVVADDTAAKELQRVDQMLALYEARTLKQAAERVRAFWLFLQQDRAEMDAFAAPAAAEAVWNAFAEEDLAYLAVVIASVHVRMGAAAIRRDHARACLDAHAAIVRMAWKRLQQAREPELW
jgi:hypothetical protein